MHSHPRNHLLALSVPVIALTLSHPAIAQDEAPLAADAADQPGANAIIITGTRGTGRTVAESAVPNDVFSQEDFRTQASCDVKTIIKNLVPSYNLSRNALADGSAFVRPPTLRGLPPDQILARLLVRPGHSRFLGQRSPSTAVPSCVRSKGSLRRQHCRFPDIPRPDPVLAVLSL